LRLGVAVPGQLAIAGFGDFELARASNPPLTTVRIPGEQIGRTTARLIVERLDASDLPLAGLERVVDLGFEIISRESA
jgi:LacI family gluconate utilization system Gnt-I transcriptional repressor